MNSEHFNHENAVGIKRTKFAVVQFASIMTKLIVKLDTHYAL